IQRLIREAETKAEEILSGNRNILDRLAEALLKDEVLDREDIDRIVAASKGSES
ncbi:MAG: hypothetical protein JSU99_05845, partial [Nitrospiraceae bacterium]